MIMGPRIVIKTIRNFFCDKINAEVHVEYCTDLHYQPGGDLIAKELTIHPDCEQKEHCGIACREKDKTNYDWSGCINPELRQAIIEQEKDEDIRLAAAGIRSPIEQKRQ